MKKKKVVFESGFDSNLKLGFGLEIPYWFERAD